MKLSPNTLPLNNLYSSSGTRTSTSLNSAYVNGVSGAGFGFRYSSRQSSSTIDEFYVYVDSFAGTKANTIMTCFIYNENTTVSTRAGTTLRATSTATTLPSGASGWVRFVFGTPYTPAQGEVLWFVVTNSAIAPATDFPNVLNALNIFLPASNWILPHTTTTGFSTAGTAFSKALFMMKHGSAYYGNPYSNLSTPTSTTVKRGIVITPEVDTTIAEYAGFALTTGTNITIHESTQLPNDTPVYTYALGGTNKVSDRINSSVSLTPFTLRKGKTYYVCVASSANSTVPSDLIINDYASYSAMFDAFIDNSNMSAKVLDNGANAWVISKNLTQRIQVLVSLFSNPTITSAS